MVQRKENAAARAALARRRKRAAITLNSPPRAQLASTSSTDNDIPKVKTSLEPAVKKDDIRNFDLRKPPQSPSSAFSAATVTVTATSSSSFKVQTLSKSNEGVLKRSNAVAEQSSTILDASFSKSKSYTRVSSKKKNFVANEFNIETVLQNDDNHSSATTYGIQQERGKEKQEQQQQYHSRSPENKYERISNFGYVEKITLSPQSNKQQKEIQNYESSLPKSPKSSLPKSSLSSKIPSASASRSSSAPSSKRSQSQSQNQTRRQTEQVSHSKQHLVSSTNSDEILVPSLEQSRSDDNNTQQQRPKIQKQQQRIIPSLMASSSLSSSPSPTRKTSYRKEIAFRNNSRTEERNLQSMAAEDDAVNLSTAREKNLRAASRIPSPTRTINPNAGQLLPKRNMSPLKRTISPEKRLSPRRFRLPKPEPPTRPQLSKKPNPAAKDKSNKQLSSKSDKTPLRIEQHTIKTGTFQPRSISSTRSKPQLNPRLSTDARATTRNNVSPVKSITEKSKSKITTKPSANTSPNMEEELSVILMDSCSITEEASLIPDNQYIQQPKDPIIRSRNSLETIQRKNRTNGGEYLLSDPSSPRLGGSRMNSAIFDQLDNKMNCWSVTDRNVSNDGSERYPSSPDENDATDFNVIPASSRHGMKAYQMAQNNTSSATRQPQNLSKINGNNNLSPIDLTNHELPRGAKECQAVDAACFQSGDLIMLRSCSNSATVQAKINTVLAEVNGHGLGKDEELLKLVKIEDHEIFTALRHGDVLVLLSSITQSNKALGTRRRRNDINGTDEIGFFGVGDKKSDRWIILCAEPGKSVVFGRAAVMGETPNHNSGDGVPAPIRSGNSILLLNCFNGGLLSIRDGVAVLITDSYDPNRAPNSNNPSLLGRPEYLDRLEPSVSETFQLLKSSIPPCPSWIMSKGMGERIFLTGSYLSKPFRNQSSTESSDISVDRNLSLKSKENILVDEVIGSFLGLEGLYIRSKENGFRLFDTAGISFDLSLRNLVDQILPLSSSYVCVRNFISLHNPGYEYGRVMQAFCEGLDTFLQQFVAFVAQLEQKIRKPSSTNVPFTMKSIHFEITPLLHSMSILEHTTKAVCNKRGGSLINALQSLEKRVYMGDTVAKDLLGTLLDQASVPYAEMLSTWLQSGRLFDPYEEFMVKRSSCCKNPAELDGDTWAALFTINEEHVIKDITQNEKSKNTILVTGKYWNAVQICDSDAKSSQETRSRPLELKKIQFQSDMSAISAYIDSMFQSASENLMHILRDKFRLKESLHIMKRYFLLDRGDFLVNFLEAAEEELAKPFEQVSIGRVQHFLGTSIHITEGQRDVEVHPNDYSHRKNTTGLNPSRLRCRLSKQSLVSCLDVLCGATEDQEPKTPSRQTNDTPVTGFDLFEIDFPRVPFPISLMISRTSMVEYKLLFRHLFFTKYVERRLVGVWSDHQVLKKLDSVRGLLGPTFMLRHRMQHFVQNLINYMTFEVVESNWLEMLSTIDASEDTFSSQKEQTVDDLLNIHDRFLQKTIDACLLRNPTLIKSLVKLLNTCLLFSDQMKKFMDTTRIYDDSFHLAAEKRGAVQRNLNQRVFSKSSTAPDKKKLRRALISVKEERDILHQRQTRRVGREICSESYKRMIRRFEEVFSADLSAFMIQLNSHTSSGIVANLGIRLDWNSFLSNSIAIGNHDR
jgi:gamma-tubulin complex component 2